MAPISPTGRGSRLTIHVVPRASRSEVVGLHGDAIKIRIAAPPVDGSANEEVVRFLAATLGVPTREVRIASGAGGRRKIVEIVGVSPAAVAQILGVGVAAR